MRWILIAAALNGALAVIIGAASAHMGDAANMATGYEFVQTGLRYHQWFSIFLLAIGLYSFSEASQARQKNIIKIAATLALVGIIFFSGSLYVSVMANLPFLTKLTPIGGIAFIGAWLTMCFLCTHRS